MILSIVVIIAVIAADLATKYAAALNLTEGEAVTVIPHVVEFSYVENRGAAFGMLADHRWVFLLFSTVAILAILAYLFIKRPKDRLMRVCLALIAGGGIGNMIERFAHGYVTDFINPTFVDFYVFNVADSCVTVGCALLILWMIVDTVRESKAKKTAANGAPSADEEAGDETPSHSPAEDGTSQDASKAPADEAPTDGVSQDGGEQSPEDGSDE